MSRTTTQTAKRRLAWISAAGVLALAALGSAAGGAAAASGSVWTTGIGCATPDVPQDKNQYVTGETVTIRGSGFDANTQYDWEIKGQPGNASTDPNIVVASGTVMSDGSGYFCVDAYVIPSGDDGTYSVKAGNKNDNYSVDEAVASPTPTPDPSATAAPSGGTNSGTGQPTAPPTDAVGRAAEDPGNLGLVLMAMAGVLAVIMVLTPQRARRR